jgi:alkylation response protein AidB-like acyl-CoA dehydrogenase
VGAPAIALMARRPLGYPRRTGLVARRQRNEIRTPSVGCQRHYDGTNQIQRMVVARQLLKG